MTAAHPVHDPAALTAAQARALFRTGLVSPTAGWAPDRTQANLISVPRDWADDVREFTRLNPAPCPVLEVTEPGTTTSALAPGADLRTDFPRYRVWRDGALVAEPTDVIAEWEQHELVSFLIGCSFTFEAALTRAGIPLRHVEQRRNVAMYVTDRPCAPAGRLGGPLVVSMRPIRAALVETAYEITGRMPDVHGAPVHHGDPAGLGITDLARPDFGDPIEVAPGEVPVFWACGVTPQAALMASRPPFAITHAPGHMLITDARDSDYPRPVTH
ncbi:putative hydro-lyase [Kitasatospora cinereorecta]|uniref:Putative hydro-lyase ACFPZF_22425 n=1 Tax=Kitasatospora cinereorecta TaxID=285560 RepID=A0ABW0VGZ3_9ACTN